jgi:hypothetical protein
VKHKRDAGAVLAVLLKTQVIDADTCDAKELQLRAALQALRTGEANDGHVDQLCDAINLVAKRCDRGDMLEALPVAIKARAAMANVLDRGIRIERWGATAIELTQLGASVDYYMAVMRASTHLEAG